MCLLLLGYATGDEAQAVRGRVLRPFSTSFEVRQLMLARFINAKQREMLKVFFSSKLEVSLPHVSL